MKGMDARAANRWRFDIKISRSFHDLPMGWQGQSDYEMLSPPLNARKNLFAVKLQWRRLME
jgi:hypothetical protein